MNFSNDFGSSNFASKLNVSLLILQVSIDFLQVFLRSVRLMRVYDLTSKKYLNSAVRLKWVYDLSARLL